MKECTKERRNARFPSVILGGLPVVVDVEGGVFGEGGSRRLFLRKGFRHFLRLWSGPTCLFGPLVVVVRLSTSVCR